MKKGIVRVFIFSILQISLSASCQSFKTIRTYQTNEARQAIAVDEENFYAVDSYTIAKYSKNEGRLVKVWKAEEGSLIRHLNSGKVIGGKLYCAHSNYPKIPRKSTLEIWEANTLNYIGNHDFGLSDGAANVIIQKDSVMWVLFAHYTGDKAEPNRSSANTRLDKFDKEWRVTESYTFPKEIIDKIAPQSISGADWGPDGLLYCTGHDEAEVYQLKLPLRGTVLEYIKTIPVECEGQGITFDSEGNMWTIKRRTKEVVVSKFENE